NVQRLFEPLAQWQMERVPLRSEGYTLDLDSTVFERYGRQEGSLKGHNPRKHGRPSHHPLLAVLAEAHLLLHGWLRSGNCGPARGVVSFSKKLWPCDSSARRFAWCVPIRASSMTQCSAF